jgi:hypothetical protein
MSYKITEAWKFPVSRTGEFISVMHEKQLPKMAKHICELVSRYRDCAKEDIEKVLEKSDDAVSDWDVLYWVWMQAVEKKHDKYEVGFDIECSWRIWVDPKFVYVIPQYPYFSASIGDDIPSFAKDYHYYTVCDRPEHISPQDWGNRKKTWDRLLDNGDSKRLFHYIINPDGGPLSKWYLSLVNAMSEHCPSIFNRSSGDAEYLRIFRWSDKVKLTKFINGYRVD